MLASNCQWSYRPGIFSYCMYIDNPGRSGYLGMARYFNVHTHLPLKIKRKGSFRMWFTQFDHTINSYCTNVAIKHIISCSQNILCEQVSCMHACMLGVLGQDPKYHIYLGALLELNRIPPLSESNYRSYQT